MVAKAWSGAMPIVSTAKLTARAFVLWHQDPPGMRIELVDGEVAVSPGPTFEHSNVDTKLRTLLDTYVTQHGLGMVFGDVDSVFGEHDVRRPDLLFISKKRLHLTKRRPFTEPADLCVEIISPSSSTIDRKDKFEQYQAHGIVHYWIVDPVTKTMEGWKLHRGRYAETGSGQGNDVLRLPPFPELDIPMGTLWLPDFGGKNRKR